MLHLIPTDSTLAHALLALAADLSDGETTWKTVHSPLMASALFQVEVSASDGVVTAKFYLPHLCTHAEGVWLTYEAKEDFEVTFEAKTHYNGKQDTVLALCGEHFSHAEHFPLTDAVRSIWKEVYGKGQ